MYRAWRRHRFSFNFYDLSRDASKVVAVDIFPEMGLEVGARVGTSFDLKIFKIGYMCSFLQNEHFDLAAGLGFYVLDIKLDLEAEASVGGGSISETIGEKTTLPLPTFGLHFQYAITHRIFLKQTFGVFYYEDSDWDGLLLDALFAFEYNVWKHFGLGLGLDFFRMELNGTEEGSFLGSEWKGKLDVTYTGLMIYGKFYF